MSRTSILTQAGLAAWWQHHTVRERVLIGAMLAAVTGYVFIVALWQPLLAARAEARSAIFRLESMQARVAMLAGSDPRAVVASSGQPVATVATDTAPGYGLAIRRIETDQDGTRLEIEDAGFAEIVLWIEELEYQHGLRLVGVEMDRGPEPGIVSARLTFQP